MSGPPKFRILAIVGLISMFRETADCSSLIQPIWRIYIPERDWAALFGCEMTDSAESFSCEEGIKRGTVSLIR